MGIADANADARQVVEEEIGPMIGRELDDDIGAHGGEPAAKLSISRRDFLLSRWRQQMPIARYEGRVACGEGANQLSHALPRLRPRAACGEKPRRSFQPRRN